MTSDLLTVKLEKLTYGGDALGRLPDPRAGTSGRAVFVPFGLPGETVRVRVAEAKPGHVRAELVEVLQPSPERIAPRCKHFGICGGCHYQHMPYPAQLQAKTGILRDQLERIGKLADPPVQPIVPSPQEWNYRNHVQFHLTKEGKLGFQAPHSNAVIPISECHLPEAALNELWPQLEFGPGLGLERVALRLGADGETMLVLVSNRPETPQVEVEADISVVHLYGGQAVVMAWKEHIEMTVGPSQDLPLQRTFRLSAGSFFQVNTAMAAKMVAYLLAHLPLTAKATLLDVYCGVGLFSAFLAPHVGRLIGVETSAAACDDFAFNLDEFDNLELYQAAAEDVLPDLAVKPDIVLVDPPRTGLHRRALEAVVAQGPGTIAYVACDPSTLARDAARLVAGGYRLVEVTPFDLFPQTHSIESISIFKSQ